MTATVPARNLPVRPAVNPLRRVPVQGRSVARVQRMLDACAALVDEVGYEGLTTTLIAERAGVAIGSVYQFFPDKRAVVQALTQRHLEAYLRRLDERLARTGRRGRAAWWRQVDAAIDEYVRMHREVPGFRTLHLADVVGDHLLDDTLDDHEMIAGRLAEAMAVTTGTPDDGRTRFALAVAVEAVDALARLAFRRDPKGDDEVLAEARTLVHDYLRELFEHDTRVARTGRGGPATVAAAGGRP